MHNFFKIIEEILYKPQRENLRKNFVSHTLKAKEIYFQIKIHYFRLKRLNLSL
jgi:hypothetical protein